MAVDLKVPEVGESITEVIIGRWLVEEGQQVKKDDPVVEIESDKVTLELPAPLTGTIISHGKAQGDEAAVGEVIGQIKEGTTAAKPAEKTKEKPAAQAKDEPKAKSEKAEKSSSNDDRIMPAAQRLLDENNLSAGDVQATGPNGRLLKEDVRRHIDQSAGATKQKAAAPAKSAADKPREAKQDEQIVPMSPMRKRIAQRLVDAQKSAALLTTFNEVDMSGVMELRQQYKQDFLDKYSVKLGFMSFFVKACIDGLKQFPAVNAQISGENIIYKNHYDIGIAVGTGKGLVVPILRSAETMSFADVEQSIGDFAARIKSNKLKLEELSGGTFTITNGGVFGSLLSTPIVNPPQSAVLGMHTIQQRPIAVNGEVKIRPMMYLALTYDHRIVDGREAVSFLKRVKETIESPSRLLMEV